MSFNDYWKEKVAKRRKSWASKSKRFADQHTQLEAIRSGIVYGHMKREEVRRLRDEHRTVQNPIARWDSNMHFSFSEQGLREAMQAEGADVSSLTMTISKKNIVGRQPHEIVYGDMLDVASNRCDLYEKYTDLETCTINYREVTMVIYRYTYLQQPFALYELVPCKQLSISDLRLEETSFSTLNIATFLMEMAAEYELRQEELNYHAKKLRLRTMDAATTDSIEFELWDDKKIEIKVKEYFKKNYSLWEMYQAILRPWIKGVEKFMEAITTRDISDGALEFHYHYQRFVYFVEQILRPYLNSQNLGDYRMFIPAHDNHQLFIEYQGWQVSMHCSDFTVVDFYPNVFDPKFINQSFRDDRLHVHFCKLTISAVAEYLKRMPAINERIDRVVEQIKMKYNELNDQTKR